MNRHYSDILTRIAAQPLWFDENAVPRFEPFAPDMLDIYADEAALVLIECQSCGREFLVAFCTSLSSRALDVVLRGRKGEPNADGVVLTPSLAEQIAKGAIHYGDPPNVECCPAGPTMNSIPRRVEQYWHRANWKWSREASCEVRIPCEWAEEPEPDASDGGVLDP